ncbi:MAG: recombinase family protein [Clostridiales bacterium]|nr:recombinase family protein [Clostridiales bacterium]
MGLRTILYGYRKEHLSFYIIPEEADIVRQIFREYISGRTMKSIADELTAKKIVYYKDKCTWTKNAVCRILENKHYTGDYEYPAIISRKDYETANAMKSGKGGKRESDTSEIALLKRKMFCSECGHRYTRRKNYSGTRERWTCPNQCKLSSFLDDNTLYEKLIKLLNRIIDDPNLLHYNDTTGELYEPTLELIRQDREIDRMTEQKNPKFLPIKSVIYDAASNRFDCCRIDPSKAVTDRLIEYLNTFEKLGTLDFSLIERIVKTIIAHTDGKLTIKFMNDKTVDEEDKNASSNDSSEDCNENSRQSIING